MARNKSRKSRNSNKKKRNKPGDEQPSARATQSAETQLVMTLAPMGTSRSKQKWAPVAAQRVADAELSLPRPSCLQPIVLNTIAPRFQDAEEFAKWVFDAAKHRPVQLDLGGCDYQVQVRDALLRQFHRWPATKIELATQRCRTLCQEADQRCKEQVQLYVEELRGKLADGANALFWLNLLLPQAYPASVPTQEMHEALEAFLLELKSVDGLYDQLRTGNGRVWAVLTLPTKIQPLLQGVCSLALQGHEVAAREAMHLLILFADEYAGKMKRGKFPLGVSIVASVGDLVPVDVADTATLSESLRTQLATPLASMMRDWLTAVDQVLSVLARCLERLWFSCERSPCEQELKDTTRDELQAAFTRLSHALATNQLHAVRKLGGASVKEDGVCMCIRAMPNYELRVVLQRAGK